MKLGAGRPGEEVPLFDLRRQHEGLREEIAAALEGVFASATFVMGPNVQEFEREMAAYHGVRHAVGVASGTDALKLSLEALGVGPGDEVLVPSFTYAATAAAVCHVGARPVFVDSAPAGFNLDPADAQRRITGRTRAMIPVHLYGEAAPMSELMAVAEAHGIAIVEDVAQATGAAWGGRRLGSLGRVGCFSFYPTKTLGGCGDGGMVITDDEEVAQRVRLLRHQADASVVGGEKYVHAAVGYNSRLDEIQAAVLRVKLRRLDAWNARRIEHAQRYRARLSEAGVALPPESRDRSHVYSLFTLRHERRDELQAHLAECGIGTAVYYRVPLHLQQAYRDLGYQEGDLPVAERLAREALCIPVFPELRDEEVDRVAEAVAAFVRAGVGMGEGR